MEKNEIMRCIYLAIDKTNETGEELEKKPEQPIKEALDSIGLITFATELGEVLGEEADSNFEFSELIDDTSSGAFDSVESLSKYLEEKL